MNKPDQTNPALPVVSRQLPRTVIVLGLVSFFNDFASDIVVPLIPILLATVLSAGPIALGLIEGVADALACFLKLWAGRHSDVMSGRRKGLVSSGQRHCRYPGGIVVWGDLACIRLGSGIFVRQPVSAAGNRIITAMGLAGAASL